MSMVSARLPSPKLLISWGKSSKSTLRAHIYNRLTASQHRLDRQGTPRIHKKRRGKAQTTKELDPLHSQGRLATADSPIPKPLLIPKNQLTISTWVLIETIRSKLGVWGPRLTLAVRTHPAVSRGLRKWVLTRFPPKTSASKTYWEWLKTWLATSTVTTRTTSLSKHSHQSMMILDEMNGNTNQFH